MAGSDVEELLSWSNFRARIAAAGGWVIAGFILDKLIATAQLMVLARLLAPSDFGIMATAAVVVVTATTLTEFGFEQSLITRPQVTRDDLMASWVLAIGRGLILGSLVFICAGLIARFFHSPQLEWLLRLYCLGLVVQALQSPALTILMKNLDFKRRVQLDLFRRVCEMAVTIGLAVYLQSAWALVIGQLTGFTVGSVMSYLVAPFRPIWPCNWVKMKNLIGYGKYINLTSILIMGVMSGGELVISYVLGVESLGLYQIAMAIPALVSIRLPLMMNQITLPAYAFAEQSRQVTGRLFAIQIGLVAILLVPVTIAVLLWAPVIINILAGEHWVEAAEPLRILAVFMACYAFSSVMGTLYVGIRHPEYQTRCWIVQFVVYAATIVPLTTSLGLRGAAAALSLSFVVGLAMHLRYLRPALGEEIPSFLDVLRQEGPRLVGALRGR
jgi:lipopolysaccharide exporter